MMRAIGIQLFKTLILVCLSSAFIYPRTSFGETSRQDWHKMKICHTEWGSSSGEKLWNKGWIVHLSETILKHAGYEVETQIQPWERCVHNVQSEKFDIVIGWMTERNKSEFLYPVPSLMIAMTKLNLITSNMKIRSSSAEDVKGLKFATSTLKSTPEKLQKKYIPNLQVVEVEKEEQTFKLLLNKRADLIYAQSDLFIVEARNNGKEKDVDYRILEPAIDMLPATLLLTKKSLKPDRQKAFIEAYNSSYMALCLNGALHKLMLEHSVKDGLLTEFQDKQASDYLYSCNEMLKDPSKAEKVRDRIISKQSTI